MPTVFTLVSEANASRVRTEYVMVTKSTWIAVDAPATNVPPDLIALQTPTATTGYVSTSHMPLFPSRATMFHIHKDSPVAAATLQHHTAPTLTTAAVPSPLFELYSC